MPLRVVGIARADLADVLRAVGGSARWNGERKRRTAIQLTGIRVAQRSSRSCFFYREEIYKIVIRGNVFKALDSGSLHRQQNRLASHGRIERERFSRDGPAFH